MTVTITDTERLARIQQFYGRHMRAMDDGRVDEWTADLTEDVVFVTNARADPQIGRAVIAANARQAFQRLAETGTRRRHVVGTLLVRQRRDGTILAKTYAILVETPVGGPSALAAMCECDDVFVWSDGELKVCRRVVRRDDIASVEINGG